jgi:hypothetical protein
MNKSERGTHSIIINSDLDTLRDLLTVYKNKENKDGMFK